MNILQIFLYIHYKSIIFIYSIEDILMYLFQKINFNNPLEGN